MLDNEEKKEILIPAAEIAAKIKELGDKISEDYAGKELLLVCVLKGAVVFLSDLMRALKIPVKVDFIAVSSYGAATVSSGVVRILKDLEQSIEGRHVLIVEDIIDTGLTLKYLHKNLWERKPRSLRVVTLLDKPERRKVSFTPDYCGFQIPDKFVVGYGLDFNEYYRSLPEICALKKP
ncbi:MAG: hypoxanthine phosphoribosyltransferase [Dethiobacteria bacterium]|jgi:hypoxanthine phosphoribosyltransferase|nr:hypoxanthine phosphoribosyltransferase [Bacillota bacterium]